MASFRKQLADSVIMTFDHKILLQHRPESFDSPNGCINAFGGHIEIGETPLLALRRELNEELGAHVEAGDVVFIGGVTEEFTQHTELVHVHFWHDKKNTIEGCYEGEAVFYKTAAEALAEPKLMEYARWALEQCAARGFIK